MRSQLRRAQSVLLRSQAEAGQVEGGAGKDKGSHRKYLEQAEENRRKAAERYEKSNPRKFTQKKAVYDFVRTKARKKQRAEFLAGAFPRNVTRSMSDLSVGEWVEGRARNMKPFGIYVDVGVERDGLLHVRDMSEGFVASSSIVDIVRPGDRVNVTVKFVNPETGTLALSLVPLRETSQDVAERLPLSEIEEGNEIWGEITKVSNLGAYVDAGMQVDGFLHVREYPRHDGRRAPDVFSKGQRVRCWVLEVDTRLKRVKLTGYRPEWLPKIGGRSSPTRNRVDYGEDDDDNYEDDDDEYDEDVDGEEQAYSES